MEPQPFKCDCCGSLISWDDLAKGKARRQNFRATDKIPWADVEMLCSRCFVPKPLDTPTTCSKLST